MPVIEIVRFKLMPGVDEKTFLQQNDVVQRRYIPNQPGFISRETAKGDDGEWLVVVHWKTVADADASMQKFLGDPTTQGFAALLDSATYTMKRYELM